MSGVSELGNLTNVRLFCQLLQKRKIIPQLRSNCSSSPRSFRRTHCCPPSRPGQRLRPHSTFEQNSNRKEFKNFKRYSHASAFGHLGTKHFDEHVILGKENTLKKNILCHQLHFTHKRRINRKKCDSLVERFLTYCFLLRRFVTAVEETQTGPYVRFRRLWRNAEFCFKHLKSGTRGKHSTEARTNIHFNIQLFLKSFRVCGNFACQNGNVEFCFVFYVWPC